MRRRVRRSWAVPAVPENANPNRVVMDRAEKLGKGRIPSLLLNFSMPAIVGMVAQALYNVVDRIFVGRAVGTLGITGTTLAFPFMLVLMAFSMLIGFGAAALISMRLGQQRKEEAERVLGNAVVLLLRRIAGHHPVRVHLSRSAARSVRSHGPEPTLCAGLPADHCVGVDFSDDGLRAQCDHSW